LLKIGIEVSQATVGRYMPWRPKDPSPTWRSFLQNHAPDIAAIDMFVVATVTFRILYAMIVLDHDRRRVIHFDVTGNPTQAWLARQIIEAFPWDTAPVICCETATPRMASVSVIVFERWASRRSLSHRVHLGKIHLSNASSARSVANV
jgi:hypothetical protein